MPFFNEATGALAFENGLCLLSGSTKKELAEALARLGGSAPTSPAWDHLPFPACPVSGGLLAPLCFVQEDRLRAVTLTVVAAGQKLTPTAEQQRAFLFACFHAKDPCPDTQRSCVLRTDFGSITLSTDPRLGHALARVTYG